MSAKSVDDVSYKILSEKWRHTVSLKVLDIIQKLVEKLKTVYRKLSSDHVENSSKGLHSIPY